MIERHPGEQDSDHSVGNQNYSCHDDSYKIIPGVQVWWTFDRTKRSAADAKRETTPSGNSSRLKNEPKLPVAYTTLAPPSFLLLHLLFPISIFLYAPLNTVKDLDCCAPYEKEKARLYVWCLGILPTC